MSSLPASTSEPVSNDNTAEFEKAIAAGKEKLEADSAKRGRGRPRKTVSESTSGSSDIPAPIGGIQTIQPVQAAAYPPGTTAILWKIGSKFAARRTGYPGFECADDEIQDLDAATVPALNRYLPAELVEASPLATMFITVAAVFGMKYLQYSEWRADQVKKENQPGEPTPIR